jgi:hypothetical protein
MRQGQAPRAAIPQVISAVALELEAAGLRAAGGEGLFRGCTLLFLGAEGAGPRAARGRGAGPHGAPAHAGPAAGGQEAAAHVRSAAAGVEGGGTAEAGGTAGAAAGASGGSEAGRDAGVLMLRWPGADAVHAGVLRWTAAASEAHRQWQRLQVSG